MDKSKSYDVVNDLLKFVLCELKQKNMSISHFRIQKVIFKIKMELGHNHPLFDYLPFYWYEHGPFSNVVSKQFRQLKNNNCIQYSLHTVFLDDKSFDVFSKHNSLIDEYPIINSISDRIIADSNLFFNKFDEDIYLDYAPFSFMHPFKYVLFETTRDDELFSSLVSDNYLDVFYDCLSNLPYDNLLVDFSLSFSRLFSRLELINDENQFLNSWAHIILPVQLSWLTFVRWVRIYNHDAFYEEEIGSWKNELEDYIKIFNSSVDKFEDKTEFIFNNSSYSPDFDSFEYKMLNATIGNYLRD
ncbi:MAG: hypothetical protein IJ258_03385 [Methanobrevibacter sp.]|uniref:hypothetical protein n=1 Tax=Methanobrevibacter sp. TaxID=66852 RepID=UPI0025E46F1C|nr:hypothetical protein [Methanobrevibacter sp.]MBQ8017130.1 hypothetical protein [Methanobrevibacter sp.]